LVNVLDGDKAQASTGRIVIKRVLIRRRDGAGPEELGEVLEEHVLGSFTEGAVPASAKGPVEEEEERSKTGFDAKEMAKKLSIIQKVGVFGSLVALFVGFNLWAIPKLRRGMIGTDRLALLPEPMMELVQGRKSFVDMACGDGAFVSVFCQSLLDPCSHTGMRLIEAARVFDSVYGFESHGVTSWRTRKTCAGEPKIQVNHLKSISNAVDSLKEADLIFCNSASLAQQSWPFAKAGAFVCTEDELPETVAVWKGHSMHLYKKDLKKDTLKLSFISNVYNHIHFSLVLLELALCKGRCLCVHRR